MAHQKIQVHGSTANLFLLLHYVFSWRSPVARQSPLLEGKSRQALSGYVTCENRSLRPSLFAFDRSRPLPAHHRPILPLLLPIFLNSLAWINITNRTSALKPDRQSQPQCRDYGFSPSTPQATISYFCLCQKKFSTPCHTLPNLLGWQRQESLAPQGTHHKKQGPLIMPSPKGRARQAGLYSLKTRLQRYLLMLGGRCLLCFFSL